MTTIKILGTGCPKCNKTEAIVKEVVEEMQCDINVEKVTDIQEIMAFDVMSTPAIVIDDKVVLKGHVPSQDEIRKLIEAACCCDADSSCCSDTDNSCCEETAETIPSPCCSETKESKADNCC